MSDASLAEMQRNRHVGDIRSTHVPEWSVPFRIHFEQSADRITEFENHLAKFDTRTVKGTGDMLIRLENAARRLRIKRSVHASSR